MVNYKFFNSSQKAWKVMYEAIEHAKKSIYLEMYIFQNDMKEFDFFQLLKEKAKHGVKVKLIVDTLGSIRLSPIAFFELKDAGVEVLSLSYLLHHMHRKVLVVDEEVAFIGGVNIHQIAKFWNDLVIRMKGRLVHKVVISFAKAYISAGGKDPYLFQKSNQSIDSKVGSGIVEHSPVTNKENFKRVYKKYIGNAEKSITIMTPYFIPRRWLSAVLHQAVLRGVNVEVLVPKSTDRFISDRANYFYIYQLSKLGVKFFMEKKMNHAKAIIIDEKEAMVGSQNLDFVSFDFNSEVGVFFKDKAAVTKLSAIAEEWKKDSVFFDYKTYKPKWFEYITSPIISLFSLVYRILLD